LRGKHDLLIYAVFSLNIAVGVGKLQEQRHAEKCGTRLAGRL